MFFSKVALIWIFSTKTHPSYSILLFFNTINNYANSKQFTNSSRKQRASRRNSVNKYWLPTLSSAVITRVLERKSFSSIAGNREWFGVTYSSHWFTSGNDEAFLIFVSKQWEKRANSPKESLHDQLPWMNEQFFVDNWNKNIYQRHDKRITIIHALPWRENVTKNKRGTVVEQY